MQKQQKIIAVAGMLAIIAGIGIATTMEEVQAQLKNPTHPDIKKLSPGSYGAKTAGIVCPRLYRFLKKNTLVVAPIICYEVYDFSLSNHIFFISSVLASLGGTGICPAPKLSSDNLLAVFSLL